MCVASAGAGDREHDRIDFFLMKLIGKDREALKGVHTEILLGKHLEGRDVVSPSLTTRGGISCPASGRTQAPLHHQRGGKESLSSQDLQEYMDHCER